MLEELGEVEKWLDCGNLAAQVARVPTANAEESAFSLYMDTDQESKRGQERYYPDESYDFIVYGAEPVLAKTTHSALAIHFAGTRYHDESPGGCAHTISGSSLTARRCAVLNGGVEGGRTAGWTSRPIRAMRGAGLFCDGLRWPAMAYDATLPHFLSSHLESLF